MSKPYPMTDAIEYEQTLDNIIHWFACAGCPNEVNKKLRAGLTDLQQWIENNATPEELVAAAWVKKGNNE